MGPLGFSLGLEYALDQCLSQQDSLPWVSWYLDDGTIVGPLEQVTAYLRALGPALETCGLQVNLRKCTLWGPGAPVTWDSVPTDVVPGDHPVRFVPITPWGTDDGLSVLGVPVDSPRHSGCLEGQAMDLAFDLLRRLRLLPDGQIRHCLLRFCLDACRVTHLMRSCPVGPVWNAVERLFGEIRMAVTDAEGGPSCPRNSARFLTIQVR